jgi:Ca-activated chloride channel homolog
LAAACCTVQGQDSVPASGRIRVNVNRVNVGVTISSTDGSFVKGLNAKDFQVFDNGVEQPLTGFVSLDEPSQVLLLVETGPSAYAIGNSELDGLDVLVKDLPAEDKLAVGTYSGAPRLLADFSVDRDAATSAIRSVKISGDLESINLTSSIVTALNSLAALQGRKTLVLVSTGVDSSDVNVLALEQRLLTSDVRIFAVSTGGTLPKLPKRKTSSAQRAAHDLVAKDLQEGYELLTSISEATGGRSYQPKNKGQFEDAYTAIARAIRGEYLLEFSPPSLDGQLHYITVKTDQASDRVDARKAYLAPPAATNR